MNGKLWYHDIYIFERNCYIIIKYKICKDALKLWNCSSNMVLILKRRMKMVSLPYKWQPWKVIVVWFLHNCVHFYYSLCLGNLEAVKYLVKAKANLEAVNLAGATALMIATNAGTKIHNYVPNHTKVIFQEIMKLRIIWSRMELTLTLRLMTTKTRCILPESPVIRRGRNRFNCRICIHRSILCLGHQNLMELLIRNGAHVDTNGQIVRKISQYADIINN